MTIDADALRDEPFEVDIFRSETVYNGYVWDV